MQESKPSVPSDASSTSTPSPATESHEVTEAANAATASTTAVTTATDTANTASVSADASANTAAKDSQEKVQNNEQVLQQQYHPLVLSNLNAQKDTSFIRGYQRFWPFLHPVLWWGLLGVLLTIPVGALDSVIAFFLKPFTDQIMIEQEKSFVTYVPFIIIGFTLVQGILIYLTSLINGFVGSTVNLQIRSKLYKKLLTFDSRFFDANNSGSVIVRFFNDSERASTGLISNLKLVLTKFFSSVSLIGVMLYNSWELTIVAVSVIALIIIPLKIVRRRVKKIVNYTFFASTDMVTLYNETSLGSKVIKSFNLKDYMYHRFYDRAYYLYRMGIKMIRDTNWLSPVMHLVSAFGIAGVLYFGVTLIINEELTTGSFISFLAALIMLYTPLRSIGNDFIQVQEALLALDRIYDLLEYDSFETGENEGEQILDNIKNKIEFKNVSFSYDGHAEVLHNISFDIKVGQKLALVGNSGGGKTTVCSLITRLYEIKSGEILIDGVNIRDYTLESLRSQVAIVFQDNFLFSGTIRQNILFGKADATDEEINKVIKDACLEEFVENLPHGLETEIGERGVILSGGQKQRLGIARAMIRNAPLVILDEATSALDNRSEKMVQKALDELMKGRTTIVIAHRLSTISNADSILVINDGRIVEQGNHEELLKKKGAYASLYNSQFKLAEEQSTQESETDNNEDDGTGEGYGYDHDHNHANSESKIESEHANANS